MKKTLSVLFLSSCLFLLSCDSDQKSDSLVSIRPEHTFHMVQTTAIESLDPMRILFQSDWQIASMIYEGLVGYGENSAEIVPLLADRWEVLEGGLRYIFHLRSNVIFHDDPCFPDGKGRSMTVNDISYTFHRLNEKKADCPNAYLLEGKIKQVRVLDGSRVEFSLTQPYATFLKILATPTTYIIPQEAVAYYGENFPNHPVGTGPFKLIRWKPFLEILLARHPGYWRKDTKGGTLPKLDAIRINLESNREMEFNDFMRGENLLYRAETVESRELLDNLFNPEAYHVLKAPFGLTSRFFGFSLDKNTPFAQNAELRRALACAFNRAEIYETNAPSYCVISQSMVPLGLLEDSDLNWYESDIPKAQKAARSFSDLVNAHTVTLATNIESPEIQGLIKALEILSIPYTIQLQKAQYFPEIINERPDLFRVAYLPSIPDPEDYYAFFYSGSASDVNLTGYHNPEFDSLFTSSRIELNPVQRNALFLEMESIIKRDAPVLLISHSNPSLYLTPKSVRGLKMRFLLLDFSEVILKRSDEPGN
ncbi:ABC transporter substrate-binding protein [candidate division KSB1 bacterium]|nr:ABC transporter substrate-binding protein [candidate division KSB1 bacterium]